MLEIIAVEPGSIGAELELAAGDFLLAINGQPVRDLLDAVIYTADEELLLEVQKRDGELWDLELEKDADAPLGLEFPHPDPQHCGNNCLFCFVHQLPPGLRTSLYVKDEDYRFSYLYGAYVTLTNITPDEIERILAQHLSPLYISVHATDEPLRARLLGRPAPPVLPLLQRLAAGGITLHTQIVVCPEINDGAVLAQTVAELASLYPAVQSVALVPVGLTGYRARLPKLRPATATEARAIVASVAHWQAEFRQRFGTRLVYAADEFYLQAAVEFPPLGDYESLDQLENGIGMIPLFRDEAAQALDETALLPALTVSTLTGVSFHDELRLFVDQLAAKSGVTIHLYPVRNDFFGGQVSVTGLLAGGDIITQLRGRPLGDVLLLPEVVLKEGGDLFLDDLTPGDLERALGLPVKIIPANPFGLLTALEELAN
ncbi:MAG: FeS-binding protein [Desulfuromonadales bacterium GWC2_61_20]|nr:MAG: FeS-binding protein [Desulfuromonadales bacterium GWC2_61_20]HAD04515.1 DUF512 domain-containing protein [Desulfuromonas sp.]HBT82241.1 DUF512 domain-containing protein [Desulfuromonas sp.]